MSKVTYITFGEPGPAHRTEEVQEGSIYIDYDRKGNIIGIEILCECEVKTSELGEHE